MKRFPLRSTAALPNLVDMHLNKIPRVTTSNATDWNVPGSWIGGVPSNNGIPAYVLNPVNLLTNQTVTHLICESRKS